MELKLKTLEVSKVRAQVELDENLVFTFTKLTRNGIRYPEVRARDGGPTRVPRSAFKAIVAYALEQMREFKHANAKPVPQSSIPINDPRLVQAVRSINAEWKIPRRNWLQTTDARWVLQRLNELREKGVEYHSAMQQATAERQDLGTARGALIRKVISLYGRRTWEAMKQGGRVDRCELAFWKAAAEDPFKMGGEVVIDTTVVDDRGQHSMFR